MNWQTSSEPHRPRKPSKYMSMLTPWLFILPALVFTLLVVTAPTFGTVLMSFTDWNGVRSPRFIGLENYYTLMQDPIFWAALVNNFKWLVIFCIVPMTFALVVAVVVSRTKKLQMFYRTTFFMPNIVSTVVSAKIWALIYNPFYGINKLAEQWIGIKLPLWLGNPDIALYSVALVDSWRYWGFLMLLFLTALYQTDKSLEEAATVEGASRIRLFWHIILPQLRPMLVLMLMLTMIWSFAAFDYVYVMTGGGPGNATELISTYMYKEALKGQAPGYASTIAMAMMLFSAAILILFGVLRKRGWDV